MRMHSRVRFHAGYARDHDQVYLSNVTSVDPNGSFRALFCGDFFHIPASDRGSRYPGLESVLLEVGGGAPFRLGVFVSLCWGSPAGCSFL